MQAITRTLLADLETPLSAYWKISHDEPYSFLLESVTGGEQLARYSILGCRPRKLLTTKDRTVFINENGHSGESELSPGQDPLHLVKAELANMYASPGEGQPPFIGGAVGMLGFDLVRFFERIGDSQVDDLQLPDVAMLLTQAVVVFDHARNQINVIALAGNSPEEYDAAAAEIDRIVSRLSGALPALPTSTHPGSETIQNQTSPEFQSRVKVAQDYLEAGDGIQFVLSQRFSTDYPGHPISLYRALRSINPSPYMFLLRFGSFDLVGASPELMVSLHGRTARVRPIAGTRPRGENAQEDQALATELLQDKKELAEHVMLIDLGRNDLGRVCTTGTISVNQLMVIERYSHVMHIVSDVTGILKPELDAYDLIRATFPAGTVSGAPKVRALQIIDELEPTRRGPYAGAVGFVSATGDMDTAIAIRTITLSNGKAYVQAGAGIVHDSVPEREDAECQSKAKAAFKAIELAKSGLQEV